MMTNDYFDPSSNDFGQDQSDILLDAQDAGSDAPAPGGNPIGGASAASAGTGAAASSTADYHALVAYMTEAGSAPAAQQMVSATDPLYYDLSSGNFSQDWTGTSALLTAGNWDSIPGIIGYRGDNLTASTATDPQTNLADGDATPIDLVNASTTSSNTGGIHEINDDVVALQGSGTADAPHLVIHVNATGRQNLVFTANLRELDSSTTDQKFAVQYRLGDSGDFINLPAGAVSGVFNAAGSQTVGLNVALPEAVNNQGQVQIRIITNDAPGSDAMVGIDDIVVSSSPISQDSPGAFSINDVSISEGDSGSSFLTFTVSRNGGDTGAVTVDYATADGTATAGSDYLSASGTLTFADGETSQTVTVEINGDVTAEGNEGFFVNLANATGGATISDGQGAGTINNDDVGVTHYIHDIQGSAFFSPILAGDGISSYSVASSTTVTVRAVVTAIDSFVGSGLQGFYISEELGDWDGNPLTSEGIYVRTSGATSGLTVGETVTITAQVMEYQDFSNLNRTMLVNASSIIQGNDSVALPTFVIDGTLGHKIPTSIISDDNPDFKDWDGSSGTFDPLNDALDFYETVEGMRVTMTNMVVADGFVGGSDNFVYFNAYSADNADQSLLNVRGGYTTYGDAQYYPDENTADPNDDVKYGGATVHDGATHGDILELDFGNVGRGGTSGFDQDLTMGDSLGDVTGIVDFDFGVAKFYVTDALDPTKVAALDDTTPVQEVTTLTDGDARSLRVATFNVENLSPVGTTFSTNNGVEITSADKYTKLADHIAINLDAPDILIIEEVQDNNGVTADGVTDASTTWGQLVAAVNAATGKTYQWVDEAPATSGNVGGAPGGNIRVGFLYDTSRVSLGTLDADATLAERRQYTDVIGDGVATSGDLITVNDAGLGIDPNDWSGTRRSIVGEFTFAGQSVFVFGSHLPSKGGSDDPYEINQNGDLDQPVNGDWALRNTLAQDVHAVQELAADQGYVVSGGDFNEFWYSRPLEVLTGYANPDGTANADGTKFANLMVDKLAAVDRFSYDFDGRSQALDTLLSDQALADVASYDVVHINTGYNDRTGAVNPASSDHDPSLARFDFRTLSEVLNGTAGDDAIQGFGGNDRINGGDGADTAIFGGARAGYTISGSTITDIDLSNGNDGADTIDNVETLQFSDQTISTKFTLQLLHFSDAEAGALAPSTAHLLAAMVDAFEGDYGNSITLASGDLFLPGPFLAAGTDLSIKGVLNQVSGSTISLSPGVNIPIGAVDVQIMNQIGVELSTIGNHEFDLGSRVLRDAISPNLGAAGYVGANYAYLSANLDFSGDADLNPRFTNTVGTGALANEEASDLKGRIAPSAVIYEGGEPIGFVGATTQMLEQISSPSGTEVKGFPTGPGANGETNDMALLAAQLQVAIDDLIAQGVNKIVLVSHLQDYNYEVALAPLLHGVDIIIAGGSHARFGDADDTAVAFPGHDADFVQTYPIVTTNADGKTTLIVNTDGEYTYLGRLVVDFDANGDIIMDSVTDNVPVNGAYASTQENVAEAWGDLDGDLSDTAFADGTRGEQVQDLTEAVNAVILAKDGNVYGYSEVYLEGERSAVRTQETNLGNLSADANAAAARNALGLSDDVAIVSIKNGGGIRAQIGTIENGDDGVSVVKLPPETDGEVSQLDVENALRFDNKLMVFDTTAQGLLNILNSPNALAPNNGGFIQIGGVQFSYDPTLAAGSRVRDVALIDADGNKVAIIAENGVVNPYAPALIQGIVLNFTANGGDGYLFKANASNFRYVQVDGTLSAAVDEALDFTATTTIDAYAGSSANLLGEQKAFADHMQDRYGTPDTAFDEADTGQALDTRIQNRSARTDTVLVGDFILKGTEGADVLIGRDGNDMLTGFASNDALRGGSGNDMLTGGEGNDRITGGTGNDIIDAGAGNDLIFMRGANGIDAIDGGAGIDRLIAESDNTRFAFSAISGVENISADGHADVAIYGTSAADNFDFSVTSLVGIVAINAGSGDDVIIGSAGADVILGGGGLDTLSGGGGNDIIEGSLSADTLNGGAGDDMFRIGLANGFDAIDGGADFDSILATADNVRIGLTAISHVELISADGYANVTISGYTTNDVLDFSATTLTGIASISGHSGDDRIAGSAAGDVIIGGNGADLLTGGAGNDRFVYNSYFESRTGIRADHITDFATGDLIDLRHVDADLNTDGVQAFSFVGSAAFTDVGQLRVGTVGGQTALLGNVGGSLGSDFMIILDNNHAVVSADLLLI